VFPHDPSESTSGLPDRGPKPRPALTPAIVALSFTVIAVQIQTAAAEGGVHNLLPILIAALLALTGTGGLRSELETEKSLAPWSVSLTRGLFLHRR
jgi:hypothetical protein